jgi:hypothetical protein
VPIRGCTYGASFKDGDMDEELEWSLDELLH